MRRKQRKEGHLKGRDETIRPLSNYDIENLCVKLKIPHFLGVFMRDTLPKRKRRSRARECFIINHGSSQTEGSHWTAVAKNYNKAFYFDSFGKLPPPIEVIEYLGPHTRIYYNAKRYQNDGTVICGHLCLKFLLNFWASVKNI